MEIDQLNLKNPTPQGSTGDKPHSDDGGGGLVADARGYDYGFITPVKKQALIGLWGSRKPTPPNRGMKIGH